MLENDERVDVLVARTVPTVDGVTVSFEDVWSRRRVQPLGAGVQVALPSLDDLILTKRFGGRPRDLEDIRLIEAPAWNYQSSAASGRALKSARASRQAG
ncbi:MAG: hypothetical protein KJ067_23640 [Vicinamibacteria bacterium]|nr:hypothetical protein [Vicinamibacteria bacterium]